MAINWRQEADNIIDIGALFETNDAVLDTSNRLGNSKKQKVSTDPDPKQETGSGIKPEGETPEEKNEALKYLISSQHPDLRAYFVLDKDGFISKDEIVKGKQAIEKEVYNKTNKLEPADILAFDDLHTLVTASIPYKIAIHERAPWMFPNQQELPPFVNGGGLSGMFNDLTNGLAASAAQVAKEQRKVNASDVEYPYQLYATNGDFEMVGGITGQTYLQGEKVENVTKLVAIFTLVSPGLNELGKAQTLVHEMIHAYYYYLQYLKGEKVTGDHDYNNKGPYSASNKQEEKNTALKEKQEFHMHRVKYLNNFSK
jgi:hypothetical protein